MKRLAIITTHPIQYNAPLFTLLSGSDTILPKVFYTWGSSGKGDKYDPDFGKNIEWDIPLFEGYEYTFVKNTASDPGSHHFKGIINPTLNKEIEEWQPDFVLVFGWSFDSHLRCLRYFHGKVPVLFRGDSTLLDEAPGIKKWVRRFFLRWVYRHVDYALYVGTNNKEYFLAHGMRNEQLIFAPHAIDNKRFAEPDYLYRQEAQQWKKELGIDEKDLVVLFAGKLEPKKNPFFLLELAKRTESKRVKFIFSGNGQMEEELKNRAGNDARFHFIDFQNQSKMPVVYRLCDIFILPSKGPGETWGLAANEAMASGCILMLSDRVGGSIDLVGEGKNGICFGLTDFEKCHLFLGDLLVDPAKVRFMKQNSESQVSHFSYGNILQAIEAACGAGREIN